MSKEATELFIRFAKGRDVDLSRGHWGEWLNSDTRRLWSFWWSAWKARARNLNAKASRKQRGIDVKLVRRDEL